MLRKTGYLVVLILSMFMTTLAIADQTNWIYLKEVRTGTNNDRVNLIVEGNAINPASCLKFDYYQVNEDALNKDAIRSIALAALLADREVLIGVKDGTCSYSDRPVVTFIRIR